MFTPKTERITKLHAQYPKGVTQLETMLTGKVCVYIDFANVRGWFNRLKWNINTKRLKQFLDSFTEVQKVYLYQGILEGDLRSKKT